MHNEADGADTAFPLADEIVELRELGRLDAHVGFRLRRTQRVIARAFFAAAGDRTVRTGLSASLALIANHPGISQNDLARTVVMDKSVTVQIVDTLENQGLVVRKRAPADRRRHALFITAAGEVYLNELLAIANAVRDKILTRVSEEEMAVLNDILDRIHLALENDLA